MGERLSIKSGPPIIPFYVHILFYMGYNENGTVPNRIQA